MNKEEFVKNVREAIKNRSPYSLLPADLNSVIDQAIAEHEAKRKLLKETMPYIEQIAPNKEGGE